MSDQLAEIKATIDEYNGLSDTGIRWLIAEVEHLQEIRDLMCEDHNKGMERAAVIVEKLELYGPPTCGDRDDFVEAIRAEIECKP